MGYERDTIDDSLPFSMQGEDISGRTNGKYHVFTFSYARGRYS